MRPSTLNFDWSERRKQPRPGAAPKDLTLAGVTSQENKMPGPERGHNLIAGCQRDIHDTCLWLTSLATPEAQCWAAELAGSQSMSFHLCRELTEFENGMASNQRLWFTTCGGGRPSHIYVHMHIESVTKFYSKFKNLNLPLKVRTCSTISAK